MSVERVKRKGGAVWRVRWRDEQGQARSKVVGNKRDANAFDAEVVRRKRTGDLDLLTGGRESLADFAEEWWKLYAVPNPRVPDSAQLCGSLGSARPATAWLDASQRHLAGSGRAIQGRTGSRWGRASDRAPRAGASPKRSPSSGRVAADRAQPGQGGAEAEGPEAAGGSPVASAHGRAAARCGRQAA